MARVFWARLRHITEEPTLKDTSIPVYDTLSDLRPGPIARIEYDDGEGTITHVFMIRYTPGLGVEIAFYEGAKVKQTHRAWVNVWSEINGVMDAFMKELAGQGVSS